jgi:hypothetical protein
MSANFDCGLYERLPDGIKSSRGLEADVRGSKKINENIF